MKTALIVVALAVLAARAHGPIHIRARLARGHGAPAANALLHPPASRHGRTAGP